MASLWKHLLLLTVAIVTASAQKLPEIGGDVVFVVQKGANYAEVSQNIKDFLKKVVVTYGGEIPEDVKVMFRPSLITYDGEAKVEFDFDSGLYMNKESQLLSAIDELPSDVTVPGSDLGAALTLAGNILDTQSQPYRNRIVVVITDGNNDGDQQTFNAAVDSIYAWNTNVAVLETTSGQSGVNEDNIDALLRGDMTRRYNIQNWLDDIIEWWGPWYSWCRRCIDRYVPKICYTVSTGPCSRTCGIGLRKVSKTCTVGDYAFESVKYEPCCIMPCGPPVPPFKCCRSCKNYPPANGQP